MCIHTLTMGIDNSNLEPFLYKDGINRPLEFYTIGYGKMRSTMTLINILKENNIGTLIDVRDRPYSDFHEGFNKTILSSTLKRANINYIHVKELGVPKEHYKDSPVVFRKWYDNHCGEWFNNNSIERWFKDGQSVAIMCVETDVNKCHRARIARKLSSIGYLYKGDLSK